MVRRGVSHVRRPIARVAADGTEAWPQQKAVEVESASASNLALPLEAPTLLPLLGIDGDDVGDSSGGSSVAQVQASVPEDVVS